jgi:hypothetical protein
MTNNSRQGYLLATGMLNIYFDENKNVTKDLLAVRKDLKKITKSLVSKNIDLKNELKKAWDFFEENSENTSVSVLSFALQLVIKNPIVLDKFLTERCWKLSKEHMFSKDNEITNSKVLVNKFYKRGNDGN